MRCGRDCWTKCGAKNGPSAARTATEKTVGARHRRRTRCGYQSGIPSGAGAGRGFRLEDEQVGGNNDVVLLTERFWLSRFGASPAALGQQLILDGRPRTIIGVMPDRAWFQPQVAVYVPYVLVPNSYLTSYEVHLARVLGRLAPGASLVTAEAELNAIKVTLQATYPAEQHTWGVLLQPMQHYLAEDSSPVLLLLFAAVAVVLLIACANVANLLLARATTRQREIAVRAALGATGGRIIRQVLTESLLLSLLGGVSGIVLAAWSIDLLRSLGTRYLPATMAPRLDGGVLAFSLLVSCGGNLKGSCFTFYLDALSAEGRLGPWRASCGWSFPGRSTT